MALSNSEKKEIESLIKKEIKDFIGSNTIKQYESKLLDAIASEINSRGKLNSNVKDIVVKVFREFYNFMWTQRSSWEPRLKNS